MLAICKFFWQIFWFDAAVEQEEDEVRGDSEDYFCSCPAKRASARLVTELTLHAATPERLQGRGCEGARCARTFPLSSIRILLHTTLLSSGKPFASPSFKSSANVPRIRGYLNSYHKFIFPFRHFDSLPSAQYFFAGPHGLLNAQPFRAILPRPRKRHPRGDNPNRHLAGNADLCLNGAHAP